MPHVSSDRAGSLQLLGGVLLAMFLGALEQTIIAAALPSIARDLHRFDLLAWTVAAYLLATAVSTPIIGKLSDLYGCRRAMRLCASCFMLGSLLCAVAVSMPMLIVARMLQGVGGAGLIIVGQATVADMAGPCERGHYAGYFAIVWAVAGLIGPLLGGLLTEEVSRRAIFWINLPLSIVVLLLGGRGQVDLPRGRLASGIDYAGTAVFIVSITAFMLSLSWPMLGCFGLAVLLLMMMLFGWRQRSAARPSR